jgi:hypothetical protein
MTTTAPERIDTRQRAPCAKCGKVFPRRNEERDYCYRCQWVEDRLERLGCGVPDDPPLCEIGAEAITIIV